MNVCVVYVSAGAGHYRAAKALADYCAQKKDCRVSLIDLLEYTTPFFACTYRGVYQFLVKYARWLWACGYYASACRLLRRPARWMHVAVCLPHARRFLTFLKENQFDSISSTHFLPSLIVGHAKQRGLISSYLVTVLTDFGTHPFWVAHHTDAYVVASEHTKNILSGYGVHEKLISVCGIPVHSQFLQGYSRTQIRQKLGIGDDQCAVLLMAGAFGAGPLLPIVEDLHGSVQVIVVCGTNKKLYNLLCRKKLKNVLVFSWVDTVAELMAASDFIITKPGGSTVAELCARGVIPIFINPIPGQEKENLMYLLSQGVGIWVKEPRGMKDEIFSLLAHPDTISVMKRSIEGIKVSNALESISDVIRAGCSRSAD